MAGPAIRYVQMARILRDHADVSLAAPNGGSATLVDDWPTHSFDALPEQIERNDVIVSQGVGPYLPLLAGCRAVRVFDLYDPVHIEASAYFACETGGRVEPIMMLQLEAVLRWGDAFLCTGPRQRDMWLGWMSAARDVLHEWTLRPAPLSAWIDAPFGVDSIPPKPMASSVLRGTLPGVGPASFVLLWNGGIWNWLDPLTPIRAIARLAAEKRDVHLVFMGGPAPDLELPQMKMTRAARDEAAGLGVLNTHVHFLPGWTEYERRGDYLLEADAVVSHGPAGLEHHFAYRTRLLDAVWAGRAAIVNPGEAVGERLSGAGAAVCVDAGDADAMARAILRMAGDRAATRAMGERAASLRNEWAWPCVLGGFTRFCLDGAPCVTNRSYERKWYERRLFVIRQIERWRHWSRRLGLSRGR